MTMKMFYACLMVLFFAIIPAFAQEHSPSIADIVAKMQAKLNLTQDQINAITPIIEKYSPKREKLRQSMEDGAKDKDAVRIQSKQLKADEKQELSQVLSADQLSQWERMQNQDRRRHNEGQAQHNGAEGTGNIGAGN